MAIDSSIVFNYLDDLKLDVMILRPSDLKLDLMILFVLLSMISSKMILLVVAVFSSVGLIC